MILARAAAQLYAKPYTGSHIDLYTDASHSLSRGSQGRHRARGPGRPAPTKFGSVRLSCRDKTRGLHVSEANPGLSSRPYYACLSTGVITSAIQYSPVPKDRRLRGVDVPCSLVPMDAASPA